MTPALTYDEQQYQDLFYVTFGFTQLLIDEIQDSDCNKLKNILPWIIQKNNELKIDFLTLKNKTNGK